MGMTGTRIVGCLALLVASCSAASDPAIRGREGVTLAAPPAATKQAVTEEIGGRPVIDDYRWLEDQQSPETRAFLTAQIAYTEQYLDQIPNRSRIRERLLELQHVDTVGVPQERGGRFFLSKRLADDQQSSIYMRPSLEAGDVLLVDAARFSKDQNTSIGIRSISEDGRLLVYSVRQGGADEESLHVLAVDTRQEQPEVLPPARYSGVSLTPDKHKLFYAKTVPHVGSQVYAHAMGTAAEADVLILGQSYRGAKLGELDLIGSRVTDNGHYLVVTISHGVPATRVDILLKDLRRANSELEPLVYGIDQRFEVDDIDDHFFVMTDLDAPNRRVLLARMGDPTTKSWKTIIPESHDPIENVSVAGDQLFVTRLHDVKSEIVAYTLDGRRVRSIDLPEIGSAVGVFGRAHAATGFYTFASFTRPTTIYSLELASGRSQVFSAPKVPFDSAKYEIRQVFYTSKDGTRVPMFIAGRKGLALDGKAPVLMTGYGGFLVSEVPYFDPKFAWWMEQGGFFALPNLRGGGEYGESWHKAGMFAHKQNVFDDWFAAAEYLVAQHYTTASRLAITGRSNGGLLMGASMTQRPELFGAILCGYPLLDMMRFQRFLVGRWWTTEYGSAEKPEQAAYLLKYSPYQNVRAGVRYPAIMFLSGDSDTRVAPLHARKMTALMQTTVMAEPEDERRPVLLHYDLKAGHSAGVSVATQAGFTADELAFLWNEIEH